MRNLAVVLVFNLISLSLYCQEELIDLVIGNKYLIKIGDQRSLPFELVEKTDSTFLVKRTNNEKVITLPKDRIKNIKDLNAGKHSIALSLFSLEQEYGLRGRYEFTAYVVKLNEVFYQYRLNYNNDIRISFGFSADDKSNFDGLGTRALDRWSADIGLTTGFRIFASDKFGFEGRLGGFYRVGKVTELSTNDMGGMYFSRIRQNHLGLKVQGSLFYELSKKVNIVVITEYLTSRVRTKDLLEGSDETPFNDSIWHPISFFGFAYKFQ